MFFFIVYRRKCGLIGVWIAVAVAMAFFRYALRWQVPWWASDLSFPIGMTFAALEPWLRHVLARRPTRTYASALVLMGLVLALSVLVSPKSSMILVRLPNYLLGPAIAFSLYEFRHCSKVSGNEVLI